MLRALAALSLVLSLSSPALAQSQAANGAIEGTVTDSQGGVLPGVTVNISSAEIGVMRSVNTNEAGVYRAPLLPLGTYKVSAELQGFKTFEQTDIRVSAGQTVIVKAVLSVGGVTEVVSVSAEATPVLDSGRIDAGRNLSETEIKNLPLVARNPYNFALAQPGVTGFENPEFGVPRISANGTLMRINYQIDGNTNTEKDRAGLRLLPMSEVMIREVKVVTSGYAPEFGQTMGLVYNAITPSGTNQIRGDGSYLFRRRDFSAYPFFFQGPQTGTNKPDTKVDTVTGTVGGPVKHDKLFFYAGYERTQRDLSSQKVITVVPANASALGLPTQPGVPPNVQTVPFFIGKLDYQVNRANRLTARHILFRNNSPYNNNVGGLGTMQVASDFVDAMDSTAAQLVSTIGNSKLNELRVQYAHRHQQSTASAEAGPAPYIVVSGIANFGGPYSTTGQGGNGFDFKQNITEFVDNFTFIRSSHSYKAGIDFQHVHDGRTSAPLQSYTFPSIQAYLDAKNGVNRLGYANFSQVFGELSFTMNTQILGAFVQDDWQLSPSLKFLYGVRYDVYKPPSGVDNAPYENNREFKTDTNNFGPRAGIAWTATPRTVVRASSGLMYDQPILIAYENALQFSGSPRTFTVSLGPAAAGAPAFPSNLSNLPAGFALPTQSIAAVDPDFQIARTWQNNVQVERAIGTDYSVQVGYTYSMIRDLPVVTDVNLTNPISTLSDGRPVYSAAVNAGTRVDPRFNHIYTLQAPGSGHYNAVSVMLARRLARGTTFNLSYTLAKGEDNAPLSLHFPGTSGLGVVGDAFRTDPTNLDRDKGPNLLDTRHNFNGSIVFQPSVSSDNGALAAILNNNQLGILMQLNSALPFNIVSNRDLNNDGFANNDRPVNVGRNSMYLPARYNVDMRYSRFVPFRGNLRAEVIGELKNVFNTVQWSGVTSTIAVDTLGNPLAPIPTTAEGFRPNGGYEQREFQLGFRLRF
jgi:hypothetical protein